MKIRLLLVFLSNLIMPFLSYSYPVYMSVYRNPNNNHAVLFMGDRHPEVGNDPREATFMQFISPYLNTLLSGHVPCVISSETNKEMLDDLGSALKRHLIKPEELDFLRRLSIVATQKPSSYIQEWLKISKSNVPFYFGDNRTKAINAYLSIHRNSLSISAQSAVNELVSDLDEVYTQYNTKAQEKIVNYINVIQQLQPLQVIDKICFDEQFATELNKFVDASSALNSFMNYYTIEQQPVTGYSINNLISQISELHIYYCKKNMAAKSDQEQNIWSEVCARLVWLHQAISKSFNVAQTPYGMPISQCVINKGFEIKSFFNLSPLYKFENASEEVFKLDKIYMNFLKFLPNAGFLDQALTAADNKKHFVCIAGAKHCNKVGEWLESLGYTTIVKHDKRNQQDEILDKKEINSAFETFYQLAK